MRAALALLFVLATTVPAAAQISTATVQGKVSDQTGVLPGVTVTARETDSGFSREATTDVEGRYTIAGLRPGTYEVRVTMDQYKPQARTVSALVGQTLAVDFNVRPDVTYNETVQVVSERLGDIRTSEVATNEPGRFAPDQVPDRWGERAERDLRFLSTIPLESHGRELRDRRRELHRPSSHRGTRHQPAHGPGAHVGAARPHAVPAVARHPHRQDRRYSQLRRLQHP